MAATATATAQDATVPESLGLGAILEGYSRHIAEEFRQRVPETHQPSFEVLALQAFQDLFQHLAKEIRKGGNGFRPELISDFRTMRAEIERQIRRRQLSLPASPTELENALRWMTEKGDADDLDRLRTLRANPPSRSETIQRLFEIAEERIHERVYDPQRVVAREEAAYQQHRQEWDEKYRGQFIAIHRGEVIDHDTDKRRLIEKLDQKQRATGRFRAYIAEIDAPIYVARGPRPGRRATRAGGGAET